MHKLRAKALFINQFLCIHSEGFMSVLAFNDLSTYVHSICSLSIFTSPPQIKLCLLISLWSHHSATLVTPLSRHTQELPSNSPSLLLQPPMARQQRKPTPHPPKLVCGLLTHHPWRAYLPSTRRCYLKHRSP